MQISNEVMFIKKSTDLRNRIHWRDHIYRLWSNSYLSSYYIDKNTRFTRSIFSGKIIKKETCHSGIFPPKSSLENNVRWYIVVTANVIEPLKENYPVHLVTES